jgi:hypothetical protein
MFSRPNIRMPIKALCPHRGLVDHLGVQPATRGSVLAHLAARVAPFCDIPQQGHSNACLRGSWAIIRLTAAVPARGCQGIGRFRAAWIADLTPFSVFIGKSSVVYYPVFSPIAFGCIGSNASWCPICVRRLSCVPQKGAFGVSGIPSFFQQTQYVFETPPPSKFDKLTWLPSCPQRRPSRMPSCKGADEPLAVA